MIIIPVKEGESIDRALKKFKRKFEKTGVIRELRDRQKFTKPSVKKREEKLKAIYVQQLRQNEEQFAVKKNICLFEKISLYNKKFICNFSVTFIKQLTKYLLIFLNVEGAFYCLYPI